jgi:mono/diheme cytochrome c family protein
MKIKDYVNPQELRRLLSSLVVFLAAASIFGLFGLIVVPGLRNANKPAASSPVEPVALDSGWLDPTEFPPQKGYETEALDPKIVLEPTPEILAKGKDLFAKNCEACHGKEGRGDGPAAAGLSPPPRDYSKQGGWKRGYGIPTIFKTITEGIEGSAMPAFDYVSAKDRIALVHHVQTLAPFAKAAEDKAAAEAFAKQIGKAGEKVPNRIPLSLAAAKLAGEFRSPVPLELPAESDASQGAGVLRRVLGDPRRAALTLRQASGWREGVQGLARVLVAGAPSNGFTLAVARLAPDEWQKLHGEIMTMVPQ